MWNEPSEQQLNQIPKFDLSNDAETPFEEYDVYLHFYVGGADWYVTHYDGKDIFSGFSLIGEGIGWGSFSFESLKAIKVDDWAEVECEKAEQFPVKKAFTIPAIRKAWGDLGLLTQQNLTIG